MGVYHPCIAPPPTPATPTLLQYYCTTFAQYTPPHRPPPLYAIHHTLLVMATLCEGQFETSAPKERPPCLRSLEADTREACLRWRRASEIYGCAVVFVCVVLCSPARAAAHRHGRSVATSDNWVRDLRLCGRVFVCGCAHPPIVDTYQYRVCFIYAG